MFVLMLVSRTILQLLSFCRHYLISPSESAALDKKTQADTQFTNIGMGRLFIHASSTTMRAAHLAPVDRELIWPPFTSLGEADADYVIATLSRLAGVPG
jgi:hypothetical protein